MNAPGVLLDTGPIVALLSANDREHGRAKRLFGTCEPPLRTWEAVISEACFLMRKVHPDGPAEVIALGRKGLYEVAFAVDDHWTEIETLLRKYRDTPISLADACLIRSAEIHADPRILTFDADFSLYRWARRRAFRILT
jgi:predicted nucleic acid-binding protein